MGLKSIIKIFRSPEDEEKKQIKKLLKTSELTAEEIAKLQRYSDATIKHFQDMGNPDFDLSESSVKFMSEIIDEQRTIFPEDNKNNLVTYWGGYYGYALIQKYGGNWVLMGDGSLAVKLDNGAYHFPMARVAKHIAHGHEEAIFAQYITANVLFK